VSHPLLDAVIDAAVKEQADRPKQNPKESAKQCAQGLGRCVFHAVDPPLDLDSQIGRDLVPEPDHGLDRALELFVQNNLQTLPVV
jgi:hypothetical protein